MGKRWGKVSFGISGWVEWPMYEATRRVASSEVMRSHTGIRLSAKLRESHAKTHNHQWP